MENETPEKEVKTVMVPINENADFENAEDNVVTAVQRAFECDPDYCKAVGMVTVVNGLAARLHMAEGKIQAYENIFKTLRLSVEVE